MKEINDIIGRIKKVYGVSKDIELQNKAGINSNTLSNWKERKTIPYKKLDEISQNENISFDWLLYGKGSMQIKAENNVNILSEPANDDIIYVNDFSFVQASAGTGIINHDLTQSKTIGFSKDILLDMFGIQNWHCPLDMIQVKGKSMEPVFKDGEYIIIERGIEPKNDEFVAAHVENELYVKRFVRDPVTKIVTLISENDRYPNIIMNTEEQRNLLNVIGVARGCFHMRKIS